MRRHEDAWRRNACLLAGLLAVSAFAEGVDHGRGGKSGADRLVGASTLRAVGKGFVSLGGRSLRYLAPGAKQWKTLQQLPGDNLYRVGVDGDGERILAAWEKDPNLHLFAPRKGTHLEIPRPPKPDPRSSLSQLENLWFTTDGGSALVLLSMRAGRSPMSALWRVALDGSGKSEQLLRADGSLVVAAGPWGAVVAQPRSPREPCSLVECFPNTSAIVAYEVTSSGVNERTLLTAEHLQARKLRALRTQDPAVVAIELEHTRQPGRSLLLYRPGTGEVALDALPPPTYTSQPTPHAVLTRTGELVSLKTLNTDLEVHVLKLGGRGAEQVARLPSRDNFAQGVHGFGVRPNGQVWLHWGDFLAVGTERGLRGIDLRPLAGRFDEWAGTALYDVETDTAWIAVEIGSGRDLFKVRLADLEKRMKPWPTKQTGCGTLPDVATLMRWKVQRIGGCSGGPPPPAHLRAPPPKVVKVLPDGTKIIDGGERGCFRGREEPCHNKCLPPATLIATPNGDVRVDALKEGLPVWTQNRQGERVAATVLRLHVEPVPPTHEVVRVRLSDDRVVQATPGHPVATGEGIQQLRVGDRYDDARVVKVERVTLTSGETRDLLPSGDTGVYWADGVPLGSTLFRAPSERRASR